VTNLIWNNTLIYYWHTEVWRWRWSWPLWWWNVTG